MKIVKKKKIVLLSIIGVLILGVILIVVLFGGINKNEQANKEESIESNVGDKKALILYQDSRGNTVRKCVDQITASLNDEGFDVTMNHPRSDTPYAASDYEVVVLASPVYFGGISQPLCDYADKQDFSDSKVFILVTGHIMGKNEVGLIEEHVKNAKAIDGIKAGGREESTVQALKDLIGKEQ